MNMVDVIKSTIVDNATLFGFDYNGKSGNIDPSYTPETGDVFLLFFNGNEQSVSSIDEVFSTPFIDGKTLSEVANQITITEW